MILDTLESAQPAVKLYIDRSSIEISLHQYDSTHRLAEEQRVEIADYLSRLLASPLLYSLSCYATSQNRDSLTDPRTTDFLKQHLHTASNLRELDMTLTRAQDRPYFSFEEGDKFPNLESLRLDLSRLLHGPSHLESLAQWTQCMDWTTLRTLQLEPISQSQCQAICTALGSRVPNLTELSITICGSIGPVDNSLIRAWSEFLAATPQLEALSLIADFPNYYHWPSIAQHSHLRKLTHRLPSSFLVSRYPLLTTTHFGQLPAAIEYLSVDLDLSCHHTWPWEVLDEIATHRHLVELDLRTHLTAAEYELLDPRECSSILERAFEYINARRLGTKLQRLDGTFRLSADHLRTKSRTRPYWELEVCCTLPDRDDAAKRTATTIKQDLDHQLQLREIIDEHRRVIQQERHLKRRRGRPARSNRCSFEGPRPVISDFTAEGLTGGPL